MAARELPVAELADELPRYEIVKTKIALPREQMAAAFDGRGAALFATPRPIASTACGSIGRANGCWCGPATPSRSCERSPKRRPRPKRPDCAAKRRPR